MVPSITLEVLEKIRDNGTERYFNQDCNVVKRCNEAGIVRDCMTNHGLTDISVGA
jgi:hypothetical protein